MKFEKPVAEVTKFDVKDILTASETPDPQSDLENRVDALALEFDPTYVCNGTMRDMLGDPENCAG
jgi:hypothetical protein